MTKQAEKEKENITESKNCIMKDIAVWENIMLGSIRFFCEYPWLCHHGTKEYNYYQAYRKHVQPTHHITEEQRLQQVLFIKDAKRHAKIVA
eukprot:13342557-Ditylum_brightwellii.AAC.1